MMKLKIIFLELIMFLCLYIMKGLAIVVKKINDKLNIIDNL